MSQVNFFMLEGDERNFLSALLSRPDTVLFSGRFFESPVPLPLRVLPNPEVTVLTIVNAGLLTHYPPDLVEEGPHEGMYTFDMFKSAHIDWSRSVLHGKTLMSGRIYAKVGWLSSPTHNREYRLWYQATERWLKRKLMRVDRVWWIGAEAEAWSRSGGVLQFGPAGSFTKSLKSPAT